MPIILGPDGPSLGGFVCPAVVIHSELWKIGQLKAGDKVKFVPVSYAQAKALDQKYHQSLPRLIQLRSILIQLFKQNPTL
jgi:urea carboxylase